MKYLVEPFASPLRGSLHLDGSKSEAVRAILLASMAKGRSRVYGLALSQDVQDALNMAENLGALVTWREEYCEIEGTGLDFSRAKHEIHGGASGITALFFLPYLALIEPKKQKIYHWHPAMQHRPKKSLIQALQKAGLHIKEEKTSLTLQGAYAQELETELEVEGENSQYLSSLLLSLPFLPLEKTWRILVKNLQERPYIHMSLAFLADQGVAYQHEVQGDTETWTIQSGNQLKAKDFHIEGDWSSSAVFLAALFLHGGRMKIEGLRENSLQADSAFLPFLQTQGLKALWVEGALHLQQRESGVLQNPSWDFRDTPDLFPVFFVLALRGEGEVKFSGLNMVRHKESNRVEAMTQVLKAWDIPFEETEDTLHFQAMGERKIQEFTSFSSFGDHRIVMALSLLGIFLDEGVGIAIEEAEAVSKTFPNFMQKIRSVGLPLWGLPLIFIGTKHSGKTEWSRSVAKALNLPALDLDELLEKRHKKPVRELMQSQGEAWFREAEKNLLQEHGHEEAVIALGGGTLLHPDLAQTLRAWPMVSLEPDFETQVSWIEAKGRPPHFEISVREALKRRKALLDPLHRRLALHRHDSTQASELELPAFFRALRKKPQQTLLLVHGVNLNHLGLRNPHHYGTQSQELFFEHMKTLALKKGFILETFQSNHEGEVVDWIQKNAPAAHGILINAGAWTHSSYALHDALLDTTLPCIEVHFSKIEERELWRRNSVIRPACLAHFSGENSYELALDFLCKELSNLS